MEWVNSKLPILQNAQIQHSCFKYKYTYIYNSEEIVANQHSEKSHSDKRNNNIKKFKIRAARKNCDKANLLHIPQ